MQRNQAKRRHRASRAEMRKEIKELKTALAFLLKSRVERVNQQCQILEQQN